MAARRAVVSARSATADPGDGVQSGMLEGLSVFHIGGYAVALTSVGISAMQFTFEYVQYNLPPSLDITSIRSSGGGSAVAVERETSRVMKCILPLLQ